MSTNDREMFIPGAGLTLAKQALSLVAVTAELAAEAEARGYQRAIDALRANVTRSGDPSAHASYWAEWLAAQFDRAATPDAEPAPGVPVDTTTEGK